VLSVRVQSGKDAGGVRAGGVKGFLEEFGEIMKMSRAGLERGGAAVSSEDKKKWWHERTALDRRLETLVQQVEKEWFEHDAHMCLLRGHELANDNTSQVFVP
jgi:hypothetical protein